VKVAAAAAAAAGGDDVGARPCQWKSPTFPVGTMVMVVVLDLSSALTWRLIGSASWNGTKYGEAALLLGTTMD
jgi:hypothetical protein